MTQRIAVIPGDGIGPEVARIGVRVLESLGLPLQFEWFDFGAERYLRDGTTLPPGFLETLRRDYAAVYFGAVGDPRVPGNEHAKGILLAMRFELDLYINLRPCILIDDRLSPLKGKGRDQLKFVVFRENTEGLYTGSGGVLKQGTPDEVAQEMAMYVDALAMDLVRQPEAYDVIVTNNLFGDILTDLGAALTGGLGIAASGNIHPGRVSLFEPVHGSAPDIAGQGKANPLAMALSGALMLEHLGHRREAERVTRAVEDQIRNGARTPDLVPFLGGPASTTDQVGSELLARLNAAP
ncbi:MAG: 3-isopropylmalate dehydrogenase [Deltaproteobacteria bacterium]|nr:MAG: 3-isopropylmalate dehydrogenase [Deltaproteobacteria bacterium]